MKGFVIVFACVVLAGCGANEPSTGSTGIADQTKAAVGKVVVEDESQYSKTFIEGLKSTTYPAQFRLAGDQLFVDGSPITFPNDLVLNTAYVFSATKGAKSYRLGITRTLHTTVRYELEVRENEKVEFANQGLADMSPTFFLSSHSERDEQEGDTMSGEDYLRQEGSCWLTILIGSGKDSQGKLRATLNQTCGDPPKSSFDAEDVVLRSE